MNTRVFSLISGGIVGLAFLIFVCAYFTGGPTEKNSQQIDKGVALLEQIAHQPKPKLTHIPQLASSNTPSAITLHPAPTSSGTSKRLLPDATLQRLRKAFVLPRFREDPGIPRPRHVLLANRLLITPNKRFFPEVASGRQKPTSRNTTPFMVVFASPLSDTSRELMKAAGAIVRGFIPNNAILAELTPEALSKVARINEATTAAEFFPEDKLQPFLGSLIATYPPESQIRVTLQTFAPEDAEVIASRIRAAGGTVEDVTATDRHGSLRAILALGKIPPLTMLSEVHWIEESVPQKLLNDQAAITSHLNSQTAWNTWGLTGKGQVIGHADTGLDTGMLETMHPDFQGRIKALIALGRTGDASDTDGHGTHTAGSIFGSGSASGGQFKGMAWAAELAHQSVMSSNGSLGGIPFNLNELFQQTYDYGGRIHSDSWGSDTAGAYDADCAFADEFAWNHPDHLTIFAAGNAGTDTSPANGVIDQGSCGSPANAKNSVSVGATENDRPSGTGGGTSTPWGTAWPSDYPTAPIASDLISYSATTSPYRQGMAAFSSRGPTQDGRIKPDVVAPGTDVVSTRSSVGNPYANWGLHPLFSDRYCFNGGTSMATPLIAGTAALMRQYAIERAGITNPSSALIKAMLVGGARSLTPGQYGTGSTREIPANSPNPVEGWGQVNVADTVHPENRMIRLFDRLSPTTGQTNLLTVTVLKNSSPLDIALTWVDYPATLGASKTLVNNLDLLVLDPDGVSYYPNNQASADTVNTVETIRIHSAKEGVWQIRVIGQQVLYAGAPAAVYVRGVLEAPPILIHNPLTNQTFLASAPTPVDFQIQALDLLTNNEARVFWTTGTDASATGTWTLASAHWTSNASYRAMIPAQLRPMNVWYYVHVQSTQTNLFAPLSAPETAYHFYTDLPVSFTVSGIPADFGTVSPEYGINIRVSGVPFEATAMEPYNWRDGIRWAVSGWEGTGDVPASGQSNRVWLTLYQDSTLSWNWGIQYALTNVTHLMDSNTFFEPDITWHTPNTITATEPALEIGWIGTTPYAFCGWSLDGIRRPDATSTASNPLTDIVMNKPHSAQADYLPFWEDSNGNNLSDWFELRYFGSISNNILATDDLDGDLWTNLAESLDNTDPRNPTSVPTVPIITVYPLDQIQSVRSPWTVTAKVTDNFTVEEVYLVWREKNEVNEQWTPMSWVSNDVYTAQLAPPNWGAQRVYYRVVACDLLGYYMGGEFDAVSPTYQVLGDYDFPWATFMSEVSELYSLSEVPTNIAFTVGNRAGPDLVWTARVASATAPFAATNSAWGHGGDNDVWCTTLHRTWNNEAVWYCGDPAIWSYPSNCHAWLDTPAFRVEADGGLLFRQWLKFEYDPSITDNHCWDGAVLSVSVDSGLSFTPIEPVGGYPNRIVDNVDSPFEPDRPCLYGQGESWQTRLIDLRAYAGQTVIVRFEFGSDSFSTDEGWYIAGVTPFGFGSSSAPWIQPPSISGQIPDMWQTPVTMSLDPTTLPYNQEAVNVIRVNCNDPTLDTFLIPVTVRRGCALTVGCLGNGTASSLVNYYYQVPEATVTALPNIYYHLDSWTGDLSNSFQNGNLLALAMTHSRQVTAIFQPNLTPTHQVPEYWLAQYGWTSGFDAAAEADGDHDGMPAWREYFSDTDPTSQESVFKVIAISSQTNQVLIKWTGGVLRTQYVENASTIAGSWDRIYTNPPPTPLTNSFSHATNSLSGFYRITTP
jgi:subtilisin family serine protease